MTSVALEQPPGAAASPRSSRVLPFLVVGGLLAGVFAAQLVMTGHGSVVWAFPLLLLPLFLWRKTEYAPAVLLVAALAIEQFGYTVGPKAGAATAKLPLFHGIGSAHISPADLLLVLVIGIYIAKRGTGAVRPLPTSPLAKCLYWLLALVMVGIFVGKLHHGQLRYALTETRPYVYLVVTFALAAALITTRSAMRGLLWAFVVTAGLKAFQGLLIFLSIRHYAQRPDAVLAHEEAVFFSLFLLLTLALWLFEVPGPLRKTATALVPLVIAADLANTRRAAWLVLGVGLITLLTVSYGALPERRPFIRRLGLGIGVFLALYLPAYWNKSGGLAQPARAIHSTISPSRRDASSDLYRVQEDANLMYNIRLGRPLGRGFGVPIDYALPIQDISSIDPFIKYVPHNGVLYVLMRMGPLGGMMLWSLLGIGIVGGTRLARVRDREVAVIGALVAAMLVAYGFEGATDQGFFFYRVAFVVGTLLGLSEAARRLATTSAPAIPAPAPVAPPVAVAPQPLPPPRRAPARAARPARKPQRVTRFGDRRARGAELQDSRRARLAATAALPFAIGFFLWLLVLGGHSRSAAPSHQHLQSPAASVAPIRSAGAADKSHR